MLFLCLTSTLENTPRERSSAPELKDLIRRIGLKEEAALAALYEQTSSAVFGFALSICKNHADAEEIMQDTYLAVDAHAERYKPTGSPMAWLLTITKNLALGRMRRGERETTVETFPEQAHPSKTAEQTENKMILETAMTILSEEERQILILHAVTGLKHREIAAILGISLSGTLSKYHRALKKLQKQLGGMAV